MKTSAGRAIAIYLVTPLPLVGGILLISDAWSASIASPLVISTLGVVASILLFCSILKNRGSEFRVEGWGSLGALSMAGSVVLFVLGSYYGSAPIHWVSLLALYDSVILYLGGVGLLGLVLPSTLALVPLALPSSGLVEGVLAVALSGATVESAYGLLRRNPRESVGPCSECDGYAARLQAHCLYCGRSLSRLMTPLEGRRIAKVGVLTVFLLAATASPIQVLWMQGGNPHSSTLQLSGLTIGPPIAASSGWIVAKSESTVNGSLSVASYDLTNGSQSVAVTIATSPSKEAALVATSGVFPGARRNGTISLGGSSAEILREVKVSNFTELSWNAGVDSFNGTSIQPLTISYVAGENLTETSLNDSGLYSVTSNSLLSVQGVEQWNWVVSIVGSNWYKNTTYIGIVGAAFLITLPFETARRRDMQRVRSLENTLGLSHRELDVLATMSAHRAPKTGKQLLDSMQTSSGYLDWPSLEGTLLKLERLGLVREVIGMSRGSAVLRWESRVR